MWNEAQMELIHKTLAAHADHFKVFDYWMALGPPLPKWRVGTQTFKKAMWHIDKALKDGFTPEEIQEAVRNYHKLLSHPDCKLNVGNHSHRVSLERFFDPDKLLSSWGKKPIDGIQSWFAECLKGEKYLQGRYCKSIEKVEAIKPRYVDILIGKWRASRFGIHKIGAKEKNDFARAANGVIAWYARNEERVSLGEVDLVKRLVEVLDKSTQKLPAEAISSAFLRTPRMFEEQLPLYLMRKGIMDKPPR